MGFIVLQPVDCEASQRCVAALNATDMQEIDEIIKGCQLQPIWIGSRQCTDSETHLHSFTGEVAAGRWAIAANRKILWGKHFYWICDCNAVKEVLEYDGNIHQVRRWLQELLGYQFSVIHCPERMMKDVDALSRGRHLDEAKDDPVYAIQRSSLKNMQL
jgi:hypothetical protein